MSVSIRSNQVGGTYDSNHIYYNISMVNNDTTGAVPAPPIIFNEIRNAPYLANPQDYFMSVIRFSLDSSTLPIFIPQPQQGQPDINLLIYSVTLEWTDANSGKTYTQQTYVYFNPQNSQAVLPVSPVNFIDLRNDYYYLYSFEWFVDLVNIALANCLTTLNGQITADGVVPPTTLPPFLTWDHKAYLATLNVPMNAGSSVYDVKTPNAVLIYMNAPLYNLFSSFKAYNLGYSVANTSVGKNYQLVIFNENGSNIKPASTVAGGYQHDILYMEQEYSTTPLWNPVASIVFTTGFLPVVPELTGVPKVYGSNYGNFNVGNNSNITNTLTDFQVGLTTGTEYKPIIQYTPAGEYRLVDLFGNNPISSLEVRIFWKDAFGNLYPFTLGPDCNANVKILFRRKALYNSEL